MKIAQIAPIIERVPPSSYGGTERVVSTLTEHLVGLGHEVTLFATADSITNAKLVSIVPKGLRELKVDDLYGSNQWSLLHYGLAYSLQQNFDIIHDHNGYLSLPTANLAKTPVVMTLHGAITPVNKQLFQVLTNPYLVSISHSQTQTMKTLNFVGTVHNGLDMSGYEFSSEHENYLLYVGRFSEEKGVHLAIEAAIRVGLPIILAAKIDSKDRKYFQKYIKPYLEHDLVTWVGEVDEKTRNRLMSKALCFLHPATWREPFGLTLIEAMACGAPVIAFNKGSIGEIIQDGKTGFTVNNLEEMVTAITKIPQINRYYCRQHALSNFSGQKMALEYESLYYQVLTEKLVSNPRTNNSFRWSTSYVTAHDIKKIRKKI